MMATAKKTRTSLWNKLMELRHMADSEKTNAINIYEFLGKLDLWMR